VASVSAEDALSRLTELVAEGSRVPLILADQWMPGMTGTEFLARARELHPTARRGLLISWEDRSVGAAILEAVALGQIEFYLPKPAWSPDEQFHRVITESLEQWWRRQGGRFEAVTVIGEEPSARAHEIRDILTRNNVPFGFIRSDSSDARASLRRLGVRPGTGPVVALYTGAVLVDPSNVEVAEALGVPVRPAGRAYDVVIVGAGPAGLAAAVYGASEGLRTALLAQEAFGGQAGTSSLIRNFLGFPHGVSGTELAGRAFQQAWQFGAHLIYGNPGASLADKGSARVLTLRDGTEVRSHAVVIATGVSYRRMQAPGLEPLAGAGVFYGAATVEAQAKRWERYTRRSGPLEVLSRSSRRIRRPPGRSSTIAVPVVACSRLRKLPARTTRRPGGGDPPAVGLRFVSLPGAVWMIPGRGSLTVLLRKSFWG
jgi:thioredoxin reductase (NADPH)